MSEIKKGDLVMVVRWPCCGFLLGHVMQVEDILPPELSRGECVKCHAQHGKTALAYGDNKTAPPHWLKKIDPPASGDEVSDRVPLPSQKVRSKDLTTAK